MDLTYWGSMYLIEMARSASLQASEEATNQEPNRPDDCDCREGPGQSDLPCWPCYRDGFEEAAEWSVEIGDRVRADWSEGSGSYDEIVGIVVGKTDDIITVDVDHDAECEGGDGIHYGKHDCAPEWIVAVVDANAYQPTELQNDDDDEDNGDGNGGSELVEEDAETVPEEELDDATLRALDPERPLDVRPIAPEMYEVESENDSYTVDLSQDACTCPGFQFHGHCRHLRRVRIMAGEYPLPAELGQLPVEVDPSMGARMEPEITVEGK